MAKILPFPQGVMRVLAADDSVVEFAIKRLTIVREVRERRRTLARMDKRHADERTDAELRLAMAECALEGLRAVERESVRS